MSEIIAGIDAIVFRGFSREQAIKIYFANHPEAVFDPTQSYCTNSAIGNHQPIQNSSNVCNGENDKSGDSDSEYGDLDTSYMNSEKITYPKPYGTESQKGPARVLTRVGSRSEIQANLNPSMYPQDSGSVHGEEDPEIDLLMSRGYTREQAVEVFNQRRRTNKDAPTRSLSRVNSGFSAAPGSSLAEHEEFEVQVLMAKGYTREQATEMLFSNRNKASGTNNNQTANKPPAHVRRPSDTAKLSEFVSKNSSSFGATSTVTNTTTTTTTTFGDAQSPLSSPEVPKFKSLGSRKASKVEMELTTADEAEIALLMGQGYPRVVATQMYIQKGKMGGLSSKIVETNANLSNLTHVPGEGDDIARFGSRAPTPDRERVITAADYGDLSGVNMQQLSLQPNTGSQRRGHSRTPSLAGSEMGALLNERSAIPERVQPAHLGNEFPLTLSSSNLNNNNQRGHSRTNSITGSVTYEHSVTLNDDEAAYVTLLMGRGYTEEQAVLAMQQRSQQTNSGNSTWNTNNSGSNNNRSPTQGLPPQPSPRLQVMRAGATGSANISPNTSTYGFTSNGSNYINNGSNSNNNSANAFPTHHLGSRTASGNKLDRSNSGGSNYDEGGRHLRTNSNMSDSFYQSLPPPPQGHVRRGSRVSEVGDNEYAPPGTPGYTSKEQYDLGEWMLKGYTEEQSVEMVLAQREREQAKRERQLSAPPTPPLQYQQPPPPQRAAQRTQPSSPGPAPQYSSSTPLSPDEEAFRIGLLVSEQESEFGVNMYDNITPEDEAEIDRLHSMGHTTDDAVLLIFQRTHRSRNPNTYIPVPTLNLQPQRRESTTPYQQQQAPSPPNPQYQQQQQSRQQRPVARGSVTSTSSYGDFPTQTLPAPQTQGSRHMRSNSNTSNGSDIPDRQQQERHTHLDMYGNPAYSPEQKEKKTHKFFHKPSFLKKKKESKEVSPPSSQYDLHNQSGYNAHSQSQHNMSQNNMNAYNNQSQHSMQGYQSQHNMQPHPSIQQHPSNHNIQPYSSNYNMQYTPPPPQYYGPQDPPRQAYNQQYAPNQPQGYNQPHAHSEPHYRPAETEEEKNMRKRLGYREEDVQILCDMGYAKDQAVQALVENDQNVGRAAEMLMRS